MTRRDEFLKAAIGGLCANPQVAMEGVDSAAVARFAVSIVDDVMFQNSAIGDQPSGLDDSPSSWGGAVASGPSLLSSPASEYQHRRTDERRGRELMSNAELAAHGEAVLASSTWDNPDWGDGLRKQIEIVKSLESHGRELADAREFLCLLQNPPGAENGNRQEVSHL